MCEREKDRERQRKRQRDRERQRETDRDRETERESFCALSVREKGRQKDIVKYMKKEDGV